MHGHVTHVEVVEDGGLVHVAELGEVVHALENGRVAQPYVGVWMSLLDLNGVLAFNNMWAHVPCCMRVVRLWHSWNGT